MVGRFRMAGYREVSRKVCTPRSVLVIPITSQHEATSAEISGRPIAPIAPATNTLMCSSKQQSRTNRIPWNKIFPSSSRLALSFLLSQGTTNHVATFLLHRFDNLCAASWCSNNAGARSAIHRSRRPASERTHGSFRSSWLRGSRSKNYSGAHEAVR